MTLTELRYIIAVAHEYHCGRGATRDVFRGLVLLQYDIEGVLAP